MRRERKIINCHSVHFLSESAYNEWCEHRIETRSERHDIFRYLLNARLINKQKWCEHDREKWVQQLYIVKQNAMTIIFFMVVIIIWSNIMLNHRKSETKNIFFLQFITTRKRNMNCNIEWRNHFRINNIQFDPAPSQLIEFNWVSSLVHVTVSGRLTFSFTCDHDLRSKYQLNISAFLSYEKRTFFTNTQFKCIIK